MSMDMKGKMFNFRRLNSVGSPSFQEPAALSSAGRALLQSVREQVARGAFDFRHMAGRQLSGFTFIPQQPAQQLPAAPPTPAGVSQAGRSLLARVREHVKAQKAKAR
jgi:hypothetical protein